MSVRNLEVTLAPRSVAVIGDGTPQGAAVLENIRAGAFAGEVWPAATVAALPGVPEVAVVATPAAEVPAAIAALGAAGCRLAVVTSGGVVGALRQAMLDAARPHVLRVIGPGTLGLLVPPARLNASLALGGVPEGRLALLSQSGAIAAALIDWAAERGIGFSQVVALGEMADVDVGDCLDLMAGDGRARAILVYLESVPEARKFLSAARAAARLKPVIVLKAGRSAAGGRAAAMHSGSLAGADAVVDAALRRAGILRVDGLAEMFAAAETVARFRPLVGAARLAIVTNGGGAGVLAVDRLAQVAGELAPLGPETIAGLAPGMPPGRAPANPLDLGADAPGARYVAALEALAADPAVKALLVMNCPSALAAPVEAAQAVAARVEGGLIAGKPVLSCWMGGTVAREARAVLRARGVASYDAPASAAAAVGHLTEWGRAQAALLRVPDRRAEVLGATPEEGRARVAALFAAVAAEGRRLLTEPEAYAVLAAYGVPVPGFAVAGTPEEVGARAAAMLGGGGAVVVKLLSRDLLHKSEVGGVALDLGSAGEAEAAARTMAGRVAAGLDGFLVQEMARRPAAQELFLGVGRDAQFGPVILFGTGGMGVELLRDTAVGLPPLDAGLAAELVSRTRVAALLAGYRGRPAADATAVQAALIALSHLVEDFACVRAVDVNPLVADADGVLALDASIEIDPGDTGRPAPNPDLAIRPYPAAWRGSAGGCEIRPIRPVDALLYRDFFEQVAPEDLRLRFMASRQMLPEAQVLKMSQLDYDREMAFVALTPEGALAGESRVACGPDHRTGEYALIVRSDLQGRGLGAALMRILIDYARADGMEELEGMVLTENRGMLGLIRRLGFATRQDPDDPGVVLTRLALAEAPLAEGPGGT
jgi:acetyltransferase